MKKLTTIIILTLVINLKAQNPYGNDFVCFTDSALIAQTATTPECIGLNAANPTKMHVTNSTLERFQSAIKISNATPISMLLGNTYTDNTISVDLSDATNTKVSGSTNARTSYVTQDIFKGLSETQFLENMIELYPNPSSNELNIAINHQGQVFYKIVSILGATVDSGKFRGKTTINTSFLKGIYFIELITDTEEVITKKIVVNN